MINYTKDKINKILSRFGYVKIPISSKSIGLFTEVKDLINIEVLAKDSLSIPGMINPRSGQFLFALCYLQEIQGDVVEIGSWQGRSTLFLANAVKQSKNGKFYAIDHFKGNKNKEDFYIVKNKDLSDLKDNFLSNMEKNNLSSTVNLIDKPNYLAVDEVQTDGIRFLFIDGDHTKEGVNKDIELFFPKLKKGAIVVFDDYSENFPGLVEAVDNVIKQNGVSLKFYYNNTLVLKYE